MSSGRTPAKTANASGPTSSGIRSRRTDGAVQTHRVSHDGGRRRCVAGQHYGAHAQPVQFGDQRCRIGARWVAERDEPGQLHRRWQPSRNREHAESLSLQLVRCCCRDGRRLGKADDDGEGALQNTLGPTAGVHDRRLGHLRRRIERHERHRCLGIGGALAGGGADCGIDRIIAAIRACQRGERQDARRVEARHRTNRCHRQFVAGQRAGLVNAQDIHRRRLVHRGQASWQHAPLRQHLRTNRRGKGEGGWQRNRYRREDRCQDERDDLGDRHLQRAGVGHQQQDKDAVERREVAHDTQHGLLLGTDDMGGADEFRGAAEFGPRSGRGDLRHRLATPDQSASIGLNARARFDRDGFAGEHGLVEQDFAGIELQIGRDNAAKRELHDVARHQIGSGHACPDAVTPDGCAQREA